MPYRSRPSRSGPNSVSTRDRQPVRTGVSPKAIRSLGKLDRPIAERIRAAAEALRDNPRPPGARMLTGIHGVWRIRVARDYRIVYTLDDDRLVILVVDAGHRREIYR